VLVAGETKQVEWSVANEKVAVRRMVRKVQRLAAEGEVRFCYEAGPCGYALQRWIQEAGGNCEVVAPSLIPRKPGDRVKTDRRDARQLAELLRAGLLTEVHTPTVEDEAVRDLCRAREDAHEDLVRCRHRVSKMLLRRGWIWNGSKKAWGQGHRLWLRSLRFEQQADQVVLDNYLQVGSRPDGVPRPRPLRVLVRRQPQTRGDHQSRQPPCPTPVYRGVLALPSSAQPPRLEASPSGTARRGHRNRRQGNVPAQPSLPPHARQGQARWQDCRRRRP
jgi:hypothetical protein